MPKGYSPIMAFGSGLMSGVADEEKYKRDKQDKIDDEYRKKAIELDYDQSLFKIKKDYEEGQSTREFSRINGIAGLNKANTTNQATYDGLKNAQNNPAIAQDNSITDSTPAPTNTPQTAVSQTVQPNTQAPTVQPGQQAQINQPQQGGLNSPQGGEVPLTAMTPQQGDSTNPLAPPNQQQDQDAYNVNQGPATVPTGDDEIQDSFGNTLTREQAARAVAYGTAHSQKVKGGLPPEAAYQIGLGQVLKEDGQLGSRVHSTGLNSYGFEIGTVPRDFTVPALPEKFDPTKVNNWTPAKVAQKQIDDEKGLAKDQDAAITANKASTEFSVYLSGNESGDEGGLNKIGFIRDFTGAISSTDGQLDSVNKSLTFNIVGFERTPGMRLTQAEFFIAREAMPGRGNTPEANKNIAQFWQAKLQLPQEWAQFKQDYMAVNGVWNEAIGRRMFQQYQQDNPIFDPNILQHPDQAKLSDFSLNPNRQSLEQYSKSGGWSKLSFLGIKPQQNNSPVNQTPSSGTPTQQPNNKPKNDPLGLF